MSGFVPVKQASISQQKKNPNRKKCNSSGGGASAIIKEKSEGHWV